MILEFEISDGKAGRIMRVMAGKMMTRVTKSAFPYDTNAMNYTDSNENYASFH